MPKSSQKGHLSGHWQPKPVAKLLRRHCNGQLEHKMAKQQGSQPKPEGSQQQQGGNPAPAQQQGGMPVFKDWASI